MKMLPLDNSIKEFEIFVIVSQISDEIFVWKTKKEQSYIIYKNHVRQQNKQTKDLFMRSEKEKKFPQMYLLETIIATEETAFRYCVAWTKYFIQQGRKPLSKKIILAYTDDLLPETEEIFDKIKDLPIEQVLCEKQSIVSDYQKKDKTAPKKAKEEIKIYLTQREYKKIKKKADEQGLSLSRYCKNIALDGHIINMECPSMSEHTAEVRGAKIILRHILNAFYQNGKYYPADLENIQKMVDRICEHEDALTDAFHENTQMLFKLLPK